MITEHRQPKSLLNNVKIIEFVWAEYCYYYSEFQYKQTSKTIAKRVYEVSIINILKTITGTNTKQHKVFFFVSL